MERGKRRRPRDYLTSAETARLWKLFHEGTAEEHAAAYAALLADLDPDVWEMPETEVERILDEEARQRGVERGTQLEFNLLVELRGWQSKKASEIRHRQLGRHHKSEDGVLF